MLRCLVLLVLLIPGLLASAIDAPATTIGSSEKKNKQRQLVNFISGGLAGTVSSTITIPLEVVKTQLQASKVGGQSTASQVVKRIFAEDGPSGFFKGLSPMLIGIIPTRAIYFLTYTSSKDRLQRVVGDGPLNHLCSAFAAGITSNTIMNPLWMVKTRFQIMADPALGQRRFSSYGEVIRSILQEEGPRGFFKGLTASYVGCSEGAIQWIVYEKLKRLVSEDKLPQIQGFRNFNSESTGPDKMPRVQTPIQQAKPRRSPSAAEFLVAAATAKFVAICATYPHEVVRTRLREQAANGAFKYDGFLNSLGLIAREEGVRGLYGGLGMHLARSVPNAAIMFVSFELISQWLDQNSDQLEQGFPLLKSKLSSLDHSVKSKMGIVGAKTTSAVIGASPGAAYSR